MPHQGPTGILEEVRLGDAIGPQAVDQLVMGADEGQLQTGHERVDVVSRVADQGRPLLVARQVTAANAQEQLGRITLVEQVG